MNFQNQNPLIKFYPQTPIQEERKRKKLLKSFKTKLKITNKKQRTALKKMAGCYRLIYNACMEVQSLKRLPRFSKSTATAFFTGTELLNIMRKMRNNHSFLKEVDCGIFTSAVFNASKAFTRGVRWGNPIFLSRKSDNLKFKTQGQVKVFYDYITIPKFGKVKLYEKGYLPQGQKLSNISFSHDGNDWFISVSVEVPEEIPTSTNKGKSITIDFDKEGNLFLDDLKVSNIVDSDNYQKEWKKLQKLNKKLRRQAKANTVRRIASNDNQATKGKAITRKAIQKAKVRLDNIKKDYFRKIACEVAKTKPEETHILSSITIGAERNGYLTRKLRQSSTKEFFAVLVNKLKYSGSLVRRHLDSRELTALGSRVLTAYGGSTSSTPECKRIDSSEVGIALRQRAEVGENGNRQPKEANLHKQQL